MDISKKKIIALLLIITFFLFMFNFFKTKPEKNSQHEKNQQLISYMAQKGDNSEKDHEVELAFFGDWSKMNLLKEKLLTDGYKAVLNQTDKMLVVSKTFKINLEEINNLTDQMEVLAKEYGVGFDGWSTYVVE